LDLTRKSPRKFEDPVYKDAVFALLHSPPSAYGINRTTWRMKDLHRVMQDRQLPISHTNVRKIIRDAGYGFRKARIVLTSNDPNYKEKLAEITAILSKLGPREKFFSIDEFGPFAVKMQGGRSLVLKGHARVVPQHQKSK